MCTYCATFFRHDFDAVYATRNCYSGNYSVALTPESSDQTSLHSGLTTEIAAGIGTVCRFVANKRLKVCEQLNHCRPSYCQCAAWTMGDE